MSDKDVKQPENKKPDEQLGLNVSSHLVIRDKETGQELVKQRG